jgi:hypothetical protein
VGLGFRVLYTPGNNATDYDVNHNFAVGYQAMYQTAAAGDTVYNICLGYKAGYEMGSNGASSYNVCIGYQAGADPTGGGVLTSGSYNILIGYDSEPPAADTSNYLNIGGSIKGNIRTLSEIGIGTEPESGFSLVTNSNVKAKGDYYSSDGSQGLTKTVTWIENDVGATEHTLTIKNGIIVAHSETGG